MKKIGILLLALATLAMGIYSVAADSVNTPIFDDGVVDIHHSQEFGNLGVFVNASKTDAPHEVNINISDNTGYSMEFHTKNQEGYVGTSTYILSCDDKKIRRVTVSVIVNGEIVKKTDILKSEICKAEQVDVKSISIENSYAISIETFNPNENSVGIEAFLLKWNADGSASRTIDQKQMILPPGNGNVLLHAPKPENYEVILNTFNADGIDRHDVVVEPAVKNLEFFFFLIVGLGGIIIGYFIGSNRAYKKAYRDIKTEEVLRNKEKQK